MDHQRFDDLARAFATGMSRRRLIGGLVGAAIGAMFAPNNGVRAACRSDGHRCQSGADCCSGFCLDYDPATRHRNVCATCPNDTVACDTVCCAGGETCVDGQCEAEPSDNGTCQVASRCGSRQYCNDEQTCICIQSADGVNRCGQIPSSCHVQLCQTNADCADLGEGYFCDTPNSGCCTDPPAELPRCVAPCGTLPPPCPDEQVCESACCAEGDLCCDGVCTSPTSNGSCPDSTGGCDHDIATAESLEAAVAELNRGATDVALTSGGCTRYRLTRDGERVAHEELVVNGQIAIAWDHTVNQSTGLQDLDLDGFAETRLTVIPPGSDSGWSMIIERSTPPSTTPDRRETYTRSGDTIHEVIEEDDGSGTLETTAELDIPVTAWGAPDSFADARMALMPAAQTGTCSAEKQQEILRLFRQAAAEGIACAEANGASSVKIGLEWQYMSRNLSTGLIITCEPLDGLIAWMDWTDWLGRDTGQAELHIDPDKFDRLRDPRNVDDPTLGQRRLLFHEFTHLLFGEHDQALREMMGDQKYARWDQGESCSRFCFSPQPFLDRCDCARCLNTDVCDPRCQPYKPCAEPTLGGICTCHDTWYDDYTKCTIECPSGLFCFGHQCTKITMECQA